MLAPPVPYLPSCDVSSPKQHHPRCPAPPGPKSHTAPHPPLDIHTPGTDDPFPRFVHGFRPFFHRHTHEHIWPVPVALLLPGSPGWPYLLDLRIQPLYKTFGAMNSKYGKCIHASYRYAHFMPSPVISFRVMGTQSFPTPSR